MIYSYSRLKRYADCPAAFQYKYLYEMAEAPTEPLILGKTIHTAIQLYLSGADIQTAVDSAILQEAEIPVDHGEVIRMVQHPIVTRISGGQVEERLSIPLDDEGLIQFQGYIDWYRELPDGTVQLIDWKTNRSKYDPTDNHQLGLYSWYLSQITGATEINAELVFLRYPYADILQASDELKEIRCNVPLDGRDIGQYTSDFVCVKSDNDLMVRECVFRKYLMKPLTVKLLDASREYWLRQGVTDWGLVIDEEA